MIAERELGLRPWVVDIGNGVIIIFEGVEPPTPEWIARMRNFREKVLDPLHKKVVKELEEEMKTCAV